MGKFKLLAVAASLALGLVAQAQATLVTTWSATVTSKWIGSTFSTGTGTQSMNDSTIAWGIGLDTPSLKSSLVIGNPGAPPQSVDTYLGGGPLTAANLGIGSSITHNNNIITADSAFLKTATLQSMLTLMPTAWNPNTDPNPGDPGLPNIIIPIQFTETPNSGTCASVSTIPCNDIFVLNGGLLAQSFFWGDQWYGISIFPSDSLALPTLTNAECAAAGAPVGCRGFTTEEGKANTVSFNFVIAAIPEPDALALVGLALAVGGLVRRRKLKA